jgi:predicted kinase
MDRDATKLIIIRGPSGVGKSTVAQALMKRTKRPAVLVDLDYYRFGFVNPPRPDHGLEYEMSGSDVLICLRLGFDVIFDGNFTADAHDPFLERLFQAHPRENYLFYLDASLPETLLRHETKSYTRISADKMCEVYKYASPTGRKEEVVIPESSSLEQTVEQSVEITGIGA